MIYIDIETMENPKTKAIVVRYKKDKSELTRFYNSDGTLGTAYDLTIHQIDFIEYVLNRVLQDFTESKQ